MFQHVRENGVPKRLGTVESYCLFLILASGFIVRFYRLETPSLWWNEILVALTSNFPIPYIFKWSALCEIHPPYYYLFIKLITLMGSSDFVLRASSATVGALSIYAIFVAGKEMLDKNTGFLCAALLAFNPLNIFISRQLRPYAFIFLLYILLFIAVVRFSKTGGRRDMVRVLLCNVALFMLNYVAFVTAGAQILYLTIVALRSRDGGLKLKNVMQFSLLTLVGSMVSFPFFLSRTIRIMETLSPTNKSFTPTILISLENIVSQLYFFDNIPVRILLCTFLVLGSWRLFRLRNRAFFAGVCLILFSLLALILARYGYDFRTWNAIFMAPFLLYFTAAGMSFLLKSSNTTAVAAALVAVISCSLVAASGFDHYYSETGGIEGSYIKSVAKALPETLQSGDLTILDHGPFAAYSWYLDRNVTPNPLREQVLDPRDENATFCLVGGSTGHLVNTEKDMENAFGLPVFKGLAGPLPIYKWCVKRTPIHDVTETPYHKEFTAFPTDVFANVYKLTGLMISPVFGCAVIPTRNNAQGELEYAFTIPPEAFPLAVTLDLDYDNSGEGNILRLDIKYGDEAYQNVFSSQGGDLRKHATISVSRQAVCDTIRVRLILRCMEQAPSYPGMNLNTISVSRIGVNVRRTRLDLFDLDTLDPTLQTEGLADILKDDVFTWRWTLGGQTKIRFHLDRSRRVILHYDMSNPIEGQNVVIVANGKVVGRHEGIPRASWGVSNITGKSVFSGNEGDNEILLQLNDWNWKDPMDGRTHISETDKTPYGLALKTFRLELE